jgi:hypothetical protein
MNHTIYVAGAVLLLTFWTFLPYAIALWNAPSIWMASPSTFRGTLLMLLFFLFFPLFAGIIIAGFIGLNREIIETKTDPNQGIKLTIRNAFLGGLVASMLTGLLIILSFWLRGLSGGFGDIDAYADSNWTDYLIIALFLGLFMGLFGFFWCGGLEICRHYILRFILIVHGYFPINYAIFLDYAVDRIFLQKMGGGYRFIHRLLLEHFADIGETKEN